MQNLPKLSAWTVFGQLTIDRQTRRERILACVAGHAGSLANRECDEEIGGRVFKLCTDSEEAFDEAGLANDVTLDLADKYPHVLLNRMTRCSDRLGRRV